jgi:hypothetical protein
MGFSFPFKEWFSKNEFVKDCIDSDRIYQKFISGNLHWTQYLTLALLKTHQIEPESSLSYT